MFNDNKAAKIYIGSITQKTYKDGNSTILLKLNYKDLKALGDAYRALSGSGGGLMEGEKTITVEIKKSMKGILYGEVKQDKQ